MSLTASGVTYCYPGATGPALRDVCLAIDQGSLAAVVGPSGGGKSTLLRLFNGLVPQFTGGAYTGSVRTAGMDPATTPSREMAALAGMVFQEPEAQAIVDTVEGDIAFGMEQRGIPRAEMRSRMHRVLGELDIGHLAMRRFESLSGGERQRVAIAAVVAMEPQVLLLDEPSSQLDAEGAGALFAAVERLRYTRELAVLFAEHRLDRLLPAADTAVLVERGRVEVLTPAKAAGRYDGAPPVSRLCRALGIEPVALTETELLAEHREALRRCRVSERIAAAPGDELVALQGVSVALGGRNVLAHTDLVLRQGEVVALLGPNGSGKSTLLRSIAGTVRLGAGRLRFGGREAPARVQERTAVAGLSPQDPAMVLYRPTVREEFEQSLRNRGSALGASDAAVRWGAGDLLERDPRDLSVGQQERVATGVMLAHEPPVWLLDEPARGADPEARARLATRLREHAAGGGAAIVATHDIELAATVATRAVGLAAGRVAYDLPAGRAFGRGGPAETPIARLVDGALTIEDVTA